MPESSDVPGSHGGSALAGQAPARIYAKDMAALVKEGKYPVRLPVFVGVRNMHTYPSVEIQETSRTVATDPLMETETAGFVLAIYMRMNAPEKDTETLDRLQSEITRVLGAAGLSGQAVISETSSWSRKHVKNPFSVEATLSFSARRLFAWEDGTGIGAGGRMTLAGRDVRLVNEHSSTKGIGHSDKIDDSASIRIPVRGSPQAKRHVEYPYKPDDYAWVQQAADFGRSVPVEFRYPGRQPERLRVLLGTQQKRINYRGVATVVLEMEEYVV